MTNLYFSLNDLPDDNFGLFVENDTDRRKLLWLLNAIGEKKLRASAEKRNKYYPDSPLFVSVILKRFNLKPPLSVYAPVSHKISRFYILALKDLNAIKIGITDRWPDRVYDFVKSANYSLDFTHNVLSIFDSNLSIAFDFPSRKEALNFEKMIKTNYKYARAIPPPEIRYSKCRTEWFSSEIYNELTALASQNRFGYSLMESLEWSKINNPVSTKKSINWL